MIEFGRSHLKRLMNDGFSIVTEEIIDNLSNLPKEQETFSILPVKNTVMFPKVVVSLLQGEKNAIKLICKDAYNNKEFSWNYRAKRISYRKSHH